MGKNVLIVIAIGGFLHLGGYTSISKLVIGISILVGLVKLVKGKKNKSKDKDSNKTNLMDPIEIETVRKPDYQIPGDMIMKVSPDKSPRKPAYMKAVGEASSPIAKYIGKKLKD